MLQKLDAELLIGQISYKQKAEIYNVSNGYDATKKEHKNQSPKFSEMNQQFMKCQQIIVCSMIASFPGARGGGGSSWEQG